jgi:hypothetical protein
MAVKRLIFLLACLILLSGCRPAAPKSNASFYVQLIHGGDDDVPPGDHVKPVGPKLRNKLQCAFKWTHYWEIKRDMVKVSPGRKVRYALNAEQAVEIELLPAERVAVRVYTGGRLVRSRQQPAVDAFCVTGAPIGDHQSWFIVVRRDNPESAGGL